MADLETEVLICLVKLQEMRDTELAHIEADDILCDFLRKLGYLNIVTAYLSIKKWYS